VDALKPDIIAIENERMIPQQSVSAITNVDDIETYIRSTETGTLRYLHIIDLPVRQRQHVMQELSPVLTSKRLLYCAEQHRFRPARRILRRTTAFVPRSGRRLPSWRISPAILIRKNERSGLCYRSWTKTNVSVL